MSPDFEEAFAKGCWWLPRRATFYLSAVWVGCVIGAASLVVGMLVEGAKPEPALFLPIVVAPVLLASGWLCPNSAVLLFAFARFIRTDSLSFRGWGIFAGIESLFAMLALIHEIRGPLAVAATWVSWLVLLGMLGTGVWFGRQWQMNRWANEIAMLKAENASRRQARPNDAEPEEPLDLP
jgi:hypothetical protein